MANTPVHVNIASDPLEGWASHATFPPIPPGIFPSLEILVEQRWWLGAGKHKITSTVLHRGLGIVQHGHDCGCLILDEAPPVVGRANGYMPIIAANSARKTMFGASTVRAQGTAIGCAEASDFPILSCGNPVSVPKTFPTKNTENTLLVGMTATDIARGWEDIVATIAVDVVMFILSLVNPGGSLAEMFGVDPIKTVLSGVATTGLSIKRSAESGWKEPISIKLEGGNLITVGTEIVYHPETGLIEITDDVAAGPLGGSVKRGTDGKVSAQERLPPDPFNQPQPTAPGGRQ